ncbi:hypothetical protein CYCD_25260 [Tenuifilaceae bacterium CYCD]|nr:hypothetical protein CYCD_25260 [Tenuifilaceae bacterium CYCD]
MIVPMIKYSFLVYHKQYEEFLDEIRNIGVVHIIEKPFEETQTLKANKSLLNEYSSTISLLKKRLKNQNSVTESADTDDLSYDGFALLDQFKNYQQRLEYNNQKLTALKKELNAVEPWGDYDLHRIESLSRNNLSFRFFVASKQKFKSEWENQYPIEVISETGTSVYFVLVQANKENYEIEADEIKIPKVSLAQLKSEYDFFINDNIKVNKGLDDLASQINVFEKAKNDLFGDISYERVKLSTQKEADERVMLLEGWIPEENSTSVSDYCDKIRVLYISSKPEESDKVPILLKNNKFAKLFEPIGKLYSLPTYAEIDLTAFLAPFFMIFFGFCLGDAGYGLTILALVTYYKMFKAKAEIKPILTLVQYLGAATILMGLVSGTVFGVNLLDTGYLLNNESLKFLASSNVPQDIISKISGIVGQHYATRDQYFAAITGAIGADDLNEYRSEFMRSAFSDYSILNSFRHLILDSQNMFNLALVFGMFQILFGMGMKAANMIKQKSFVFSISTISWMILIIGLIVLQGGAAAGYFTKESVTMPTYILLGVSGIGILFFNDPSANIFISFAKGLYDIYGMATGIFGDLLSYIRLFALGTSGAILGFVINQIAVQFLSIHYAGPILFVIFLIIGHTLVLLLSVLGAFVHPLRLTFVEFYKNSGFAGGGKAYKPFTN